jgi:signal transduction histidine kinase
VLILVTSGVALLLVGALLMSSGLRWYRGTVENQLRTLAAQISYYSDVPLDLDSPENGKQILDGLAFNSDIVCAGLYRLDSSTLCTYLRPGSHAEVPNRPPAEGFHAVTWQLVRGVTNSASHARVGTVYLQLDRGVEVRFIRKCLGAVGGSLVLSALVAVILAGRFQRGITVPVLQLLRTTQQVSTSKDYALRAQKFNDDELGQLVDGFNEMLTQIQARDGELKRQRERLEQEVAERTHELTAANRDLLLAKEKADAARKIADAANETKSAFLANMSHELRTPLNAIIGYSEMLEEECQTLSQTALVPDLQRIHAAGKHLLGLINEVLDLSKIEAGKMTLYLEEFDIAPLIQDVTATVAPLLKRNGNQLAVICPSNIGSIRADQTKLRQTLFNLLSNASKFTQNGRISLSVLRRQNDRAEELVATVEDTGIGMTPDQVARLFQAFAQADNSIARKYGGTGLGLVLSRKFCQLMGGDLTVTSELNRGSCFTMIVPCLVQLQATDGQSVR